jgi:hypothetical protein
MDASPTRKRQVRRQQIVDEKALLETRHPHMLTGFSPFTGLPSFYGLGWNVSYDQQGRLRLNHSGAFALDAATHVNLAPSEQLGVVVLTNAYPIGVAEALGTTFLDTALYGKPTQDWFAIFKQAFSNPAAVGTVLGFDYSRPPASPTPALKNSAYVGRFTNDYFGDISIVEKDGGLAIVEGPRNKTSRCSITTAIHSPTRQRMRTLSAEAALPLLSHPMARRTKFSWKISMCAAKELSNALTNENKNQQSSKPPSARDTIVILSDAKDLWYFFQLPRDNQRCFASLNMTAWRSQV